MYRTGKRERSKAVIFRGNFDFFTVSIFFQKKLPLFVIISRSILRTVGQLPIVLQSDRSAALLQSGGRK